MSLQHQLVVPALEAVVRPKPELGQGDAEAGVLNASPRKLRVQIVAPLIIIKKGRQRETKGEW